jgi:hypothetical protein
VGGGSSIMATSLTLLAGAAIAAILLGGVLWAQARGQETAKAAGGNSAGVRNGIENISVDEAADERLGSAKKKKKGKRKTGPGADEPAGSGAGTAVDTTPTTTTQLVIEYDQVLGMYQNQNQNQNHADGRGWRMRVVRT